MDRMLVVVFDNETKAYQGKSALKNLDREGSITLYGSAVILKHADGSVSVKDENYAAPLATLVGTPIGSLIGLIGGPTGFAIGTLSGFMFGGLVDLDNARVGEDYLDDVAKALTPNKVAIVAEVDEEWTTPVDTQMEALGGTVLRRALSEVQDTVNDEAIAAMKADVAQFKAEIKKANDDRKKKLQAKIDALQAKIDAAEERVKERQQAQKTQQKAKRQVLKSNAAAAARALKELANTPV